MGLPGRGVSQERIVGAVTLMIFGYFSLFVEGFFTSSNIEALLQNVSVLGMLGIAMVLTVLGRGIDLSIVATMAVSVAWFLQQLSLGVSLGQALSVALVFALAVGLINGVLIAFVEIPAIFTTLAMGSVVYGFGKYFMVTADVIYLPENWKWLSVAVTARPLGIPVPVAIFAATAMLAYIFLNYVRQGRFVYATGENPVAARTTGVPVRTLIILQYMLSSVVALFAGLLMSMLVVSMNTRIVSSTLVYDVILVVVLGGVSLSGGKGGVLSVVMGTLLIGVLLNGMTLLDLNYTIQNVIKALILLGALMLDTLANPRDEQTAQQGDI